ncbi:MAG: hypothetical protein FJX59_20995 [Alphaproteobacteria bacterium]|nr:hypothetical protein [Alphaproteobacteria bacterium]
MARRKLIAQGKHRTISGRIAYVSDADHDRGRRRGEETFTVTIHGDGTHLQRANCVIEEEPHIVRDVMQRSDAALNPIACFVSIRTGGLATGSGWFRWADGTATCDAETRAEGRLSHRAPYRDGPRAFCNHSIVGDAWMAAHYPMARGPGLFLCEQMFTPSRNKQGATGPSLAMLKLGLQYLGRERVSVPAGTFDTYAFRLNSVPGLAALRTENLHYEIWTTTDGSFIAVQSMYRGRRRYELVEYTES